MSSLREMFVSIAFKDNASKAVQNVNKSMDAVKKSMGGTSTAATEVGKTATNAGKGMKTTSKAATEVSKTVTNAGKSMKTTNTAASTVGKTVANAGRSFTRSNKSVQVARSAYLTAGKAMQTTARQASGVGKAADNSSRKVGLMGRAFQAAQRTALTAGTAFEGLGRRMSSSVGSGLGRLKSGFSGLPGIAGGAAKKVGSSITNFITSPLRGAVGMVKQYAGALGLLSGGALAASGMGRLSAIENAQTSLTVMMGDAKTANAFMDDVLAFAKTTPFAFPDLAETSRNLIAFGMDKGKVVPTMKAIGDAAAATGKGSEGLNQVASAFGDMQIAGTLGLDQINRLQSAGVPALKIMANTFGISTDEMKKKISDGSVDSVKAIDQLVKGMQDGTDGVAGSTAAMAGIMEKTKDNWTGSVDSMKSSISSTMATLMEPIKPYIQDAMAWFGDTFSKIPDIVFGAFNAIKPIIEQIKPIFDDVMAGFGEFAAPVKQAFSEIGEAITSFITDVAIPNLPMVKEYFLNAFEAISPVIEVVWSILQDVGSVIMNLVENVAIPLIPVLQEVVLNAFTAIQPILNVVKTVFSGIATAVMFLVDNVIVPLIPVAQSILETAFNIINPILSVASSLFEAVWTVIKFLVEVIVKPLIPEIADVITNMWTLVKPILDGIVTVFDAIADSIEWAVGKFKDFASAAKDFKMPKIGMPKWMGGGGVIQKDGSHATGLGRVPKDGYMAELHRNESVLTAEQSNALRSAGMLHGDGVGPTLDLSKSSAPAATSSGTPAISENNNTFHFHISGDNAKDIASEVKREIENFFDSMNRRMPRTTEL